MNTYLYSKPTFTSPQPLAAATGLTIPLQITLSEIKLSAFIILVFSKQKGVTLVFRNDPLESLKVSSTFDSIQFVRDYLQRTIEEKLRDLIMDELPAIIHRLSLQLWCPDQLPKDDADALNERGETFIDPLASPPQDAVDANGNLLDASDIASLTSNGGAELQPLFSNKNLLRFAALTKASRTFSMFTPSIRDVVFRAWAGPLDRSEPSNSPPFATPNLVRSHSHNGSLTTYTFSDTSSQEHGVLPSRPSLVSLNSATTGLSLGSNRHSKTYAGRRKKTRVVNLRKDKTVSAPVSNVGDNGSDTVSVQGPSSEPIVPASIAEEPEEETLVGTISTGSKVRFRTGDEKILLPRRQPLNVDMYNTPAEGPAESAEAEGAAIQKSMTSSTETITSSRAAPQSEKPSSETKQPITFESRKEACSDTSSVILEQAWIMKMAGEIARRVYDEKQRNPRFWEDRDDAPPPAYEAR